MVRALIMNETVASAATVAHALSIVDAITALAKKKEVSAGIYSEASQSTRAGDMGNRLTFMPHSQQLLCTRARSAILAREASPLGTDAQGPT